MRGFMVANVFFMIIPIVFTIYGFVLFVKLATRGIKALDIYIQKNQHNGD